MVNITERIADIENELKHTQTHKGTEKHIGRLKMRLCQLKRDLEVARSSGGGGGGGFDVARTGNATVALVGFPSVGKSSLQNIMTTAESRIAAYEFTTLSCIPGILELKGARLQMLDLPGIIEGASDNKGRGRQVIAAARTADLILMILDASKGDQQRRKLEVELEDMGLRLNKEKPDITISRKATGGIKIANVVPLKELNLEAVTAVLKEMKIHNADVLIRQDCSIDAFIDIIIGNRSYVKCLYVYNKIDTVSLEAVKYFASQRYSVVCAANWNMNIDHLKERMWEILDLKRVYTKADKTTGPDFEEPLVLRHDTETISDVCMTIHRNLVDNFRYAYVWGASAKHQPQKAGLKHRVADEDVVQIVSKR